MTYEEAKILQSYWHIVVDELEAQIQAETNRLRVCSKDDLEKIQSYIKVYEALKTLPYDVAERLGTQA